MKKLELFLNIIHYQWFKFELWSSDIIQYPFILIMRPMYKSKWCQKRTGWDNPEKELKKAMRDPEKSVNSILAGGAIGGLIYLYLWGIAILISAMFNAFLPKWAFVLTFIIALIINYGLIWKDDLYLKYFKEFNKKPKNWQRKWAWITFFTALGVILFLIGCFTIHSKIINA
ncbi:hypothetical protein [Empedobacter brevis]|uniref:hypothetical protein n=1 Tax=Empedobacter brevis TaxID=247 RepID=UPI002FE36410